MRAVFLSGVQFWRRVQGFDQQLEMLPEYQIEDIPHREHRTITKKHAAS